MKSKNKIMGFIKRIESEDKKRQQKFNIPWLLKITIIAFLISITFSIVSSSIIPNANLIIGVLIIIVFIIIGVIFDMVGTAVTSADEKPFHSMSSKKIRGAQTAVTLIKNAEKVSSFCNDVIGDISGIVSGSAGIIIASSLSNHFGFKEFTLELIVTAVIASMTIGGKALGKGYAINHSDKIVYQFAKIISIFNK